MKVLITGAGGFIGSHLVAAELDRGSEVIAVDIELARLDRWRGHERLQMCKASISDTALMAERLQGVATLYHLASAHLDVSLAESVYEEVNVRASLALVKAAHKAGVGRIVHCSSVGVMGNIVSPPADERTPCRPTNIYGRTKLAGERAILAYAQEAGAPVVVVRPAWVYGPSCPRTERLLRLVRKGRFPIFGRGLNRRHPLYVADLIDGLWRSAERPGIEGELFILAGHTSVTLQELLTAFARASGTSPPRLHLPLSLGLLAGHALEVAFSLIGRRPPFSVRSLDFYRENNAYSIAKAARQLKFAPQYDLAAGLQATVRMAEQGPQ